MTGPKSRRKSEISENFWPRLIMLGVSFFFSCIAMGGWANRRLIDGMIRESGGVDETD